MNPFVKYPALILGLILIFFSMSRVRQNRAVVQEADQVIPILNFERVDSTESLPEYKEHLLEYNEVLSLH